jgi:hypothetical protein
MLVLDTIAERMKESISRPVPSMESFLTDRSELTRLDIVLPGLD